MEVCETISGGYLAGCERKNKGKLTRKNKENNKKYPIRYYKILFKIALNSLFNEWGVHVRREKSNLSLVEAVA